MLACEKFPAKMSGKYGREMKSAGYEKGAHKGLLFRYRRVLLSNQDTFMLNKWGNKFKAIICS